MKKNMTRQSTGIAKAKYVVETHCDNGNVFLHGPFGSKTKAEDNLETSEEDDWTHLDAFLERGASGHYPISTHKVRAILHPDKWTKKGK